MNIATVADEDFADLLPLLRSYLEFYGVDPDDEAQRSLSRSIIADSDNQGFQILARDEAGRATGFATVYWSWSTLSGSRIAIMNDLFVDADHRGQGIGTALIEACRLRAGERGATSLQWQTAKDNIPAQNLYTRVGALREEWIDYSLHT